MNKEHLRIGKEGEDIACTYLEAEGYKIMGRNVRINAHDELDIIAFDPAEHMLVFIEVKARKKLDEDYNPLLNITRRKKRALSRAARSFVTEHDIQYAYRIDVLCVASGKVTLHIREIEMVDED